MDTVTMTSGELEDKLADARDEGYLKGERISLVYLLGHILRTLGYNSREQSNVVELAKLVEERELIRAKVQELVESVNEEFDPDLNLCDQLETVHRYLEE